MRTGTPLLTRPLLTRKEAATQLHISEATLVRLARAGAIPEVRVSERTIRIEPDVIDHYIARRRSHQRAAVSVRAEAAA